MNIRKIIASAAALTVASLSSGCGAAEVLYGESSEIVTYSDMMSQKEEASNQAATDEEGNTVAEEENAEEAEMTFMQQVELNVDPEKTLAYVEDPAAVYEKIEYTPEMFFGKYTKAGVKGVQLSEEDAAKFASEMDYMECSSFDVPVTALPYRIEAGPHSNVTAMNYLSGHNFMNLYFVSADGARQTVQASYTVKGDTISFNPVRNFNYDSDANQLDYSFTGKNLKYTFKFDGPTIVFSKGNKSVKLYAEDLYNNQEIDLTECSLKDGSDKFNEVQELNFTADSQDYIKLGDRENRDVNIQLCEDGICRLRWADASGETFSQLAYFYCDDDGIVLTDGNKRYYYTARSWDIYTQNVSANLSINDAQTLKEMDTEKVEEIINKNDELYNDLQSAFDSVGVGASINRETGEIALDSLVLFSSESSDVSDEGKDFINRFLTAYTSVIFNEKYDGFIKTITVEGHTDTNGSYEYNQKLSQERADNVKDYCLTGESGLDEAALGKLGNMLEAVGYTYDKPILNEDGTVNMGASRRVSFKFIINLEQ